MDLLREFFLKAIVCNFIYLKMYMRVEHCLIPLLIALKILNLYDYTFLMLSLSSIVYSLYTDYSIMDRPFSKTVIMFSLFHDFPTIVWLFIFFIVLCENIIYKELFENRESIRDKKNFHIYFQSTEQFLLDLDEDSDNNIDRNLSDNEF